MDKIQGPRYRIEDQTITNSHEIGYAFKKWKEKWEKVENSPVHECFNGTLLSEIRCPNCNKTSYSFSKFYELNLEIDDNQMNSYGYSDNSAE